MWRSIFKLVLTCISMSYVHALTCKDGDSDPCVCNFADGSGKIDLNSAGNSDGSAKFINIADAGIDPSTTYSYNPCHGFTSSTGETNLAGSSTSYEYEVGIGTQDTAQFGSGDGSTTDFTISYSDTYSSMKVSFVCDKSTEDSVTNEASEDETTLFTFTGNSACKGGGSGSGGISAGGVILILFFVFIFLYLLIGSLYRNKFKQANGSDVIPNKEFWTSLPGLIKDGAMFLISKCKGDKGSYENI